MCIVVVNDNDDDNDDDDEEEEEEEGEETEEEEEENEEEDEDICDMAVRRPLQLWGAYYGYLGEHWPSCNWLHCNVRRHSRHLCCTMIAHTSRIILNWFNMINLRATGYISRDMRTDSLPTEALAHCARMLQIY